MREIEYRAGCLEDINMKDENSEIRNYANYVNTFLYKALGAEYNNDNAMVSLQFANPENFHCIGFPVNYPIQKFHPKKQTTATIGDVCINGSADWGYGIFCETAFSYYTDSGFHKGEVRSLVFDLDWIPEINDDSIEEEDVVKFAMQRIPFLRMFPPHAVIATGNKGMHVIYTFSNNLMNRKNDAEALMDFFGQALEADKGHLSLGATLRIPGTVNIATGKLAKGAINPDYKIMDSTSYIEFCKKILDNYVIMQMYNGEIRWMNRKEYENTYCDWDDEDNVIYPSKQAQEMCGYDLLGSDILSVQNKNYKKPYYTGKKPKNTEAKQSKGADSIYDINRKTAIGMMMADLRKYFEENDGDIIGHRNNFLFIATSLLIMAKASDEVIETEIFTFNKRFSKPLPDSEVNCIIRCCKRHKYKISADYMKNALDLSEEFMRRSNICYTEKRRKERVLKNNKKHNKIRVKRTKDKKKKQYAIIKRMYKKGTSISDIMKQTNLSRNTVKKYIRIAKSEIRDEQKKERLQWKDRENKDSLISTTMNEKNDKLRPAQLFGKRLRISNENMEIMMAMEQLRQEKRNLWSAE